MSPEHHTHASGAALAAAPWRPPDAARYAYLLGVHLCDGEVAPARNGLPAALRLTLDAAHPRIVEECAEAMAVVGDGGPVDVRTPRTGDVRVLESFWPGWPEALPAPGAGAPHRRAIALAGWQRAIAEAYPGPFVRGLLHADGCRTVNRFRSTLPSGRVRKYAYPRYFFSNVNPDVRALFRDACTALGVRTTVSTARNVSVSHRDSVARLEEIVGPKA